MWSPTLTAVLFSVLLGQQLFCASGNRNAADPNKNSVSICKPKLTAKLIGSRSTCTFTMKEDYNFRRVPSKIYHYNCNCPEKRCSDSDDYRCTQLKEKMQVSTAAWNAKTTIISVSVNTSCVCAAPRSKEPYQTDRTLDENGDKKVRKDVNGTTRIDVGETRDQL